LGRLGAVSSAAADGGCVLLPEPRWEPDCRAERGACTTCLQRGHGPVVPAELSSTWSGALQWGQANAIIT
jgi:hypothetical protein